MPRGLQLAQVLAHQPGHLELWVKVKEGWSDDENAMRKFGYES